MKTAKETHFRANGLSGFGIYDATVCAACGKLHAVQVNTTFGGASNPARQKASEDTMIARGLAQLPRFSDLCKCERDEPEEPDDDDDEDETEALGESACVEGKPETRPGGTRHQTKLEYK